MNTILVMYLYFTSQGDKTIYCQMIGRGYDFEVPGFGYDRFVTLDCGNGLRHAGIKPSKLDPEIRIVLGSKVYPVSTQYEKDLANAIYPKVSKTKSDKN